MFDVPPLDIGFFIIANPQAKVKESQSKSKGRLSGDSHGSEEGIKKPTDRMVRPVMLNDNDW
jgi:hypothetical protein